MQPAHIADLMRSLLQARPTVAVIGDDAGLMAYDDIAAALKLPDGPSVQPPKSGPFSGLGAR
jgi:hypothetical protein